MERWEIGMLAKSMAGHDQNRVYVIVRIEDDLVYLADGKIRTLDRLKKKKKKHLQLIRKQNNIENMDDAGIRRILNNYKKTESIEMMEES